MSTLKLVVNNSDSDAGSEERAGEFVEHNAPVLASETLMFILGHASHDELLATCQQQLVDWWALGIAGGQSASDYESVYWYLLFLVESRRDFELLGNRYINQRAKECACYLINKGKLPRVAHGIRP